MSILVDTGIFFGLYSKKDVHHLDSIILITYVLEGKWGRPYITEHILDETLTLLKYKISTDAAQKFITAFIKSKNMGILLADEKDITNSLSLFEREQKTKGLSFTDAVSVALAQRNNLTYLMTYDLYLSKFVKIISFRYIQTLSEKEVKKILNMLPEGIS